MNLTYQQTCRLYRGLLGTTAGLMLQVSPTSVVMLCDGALCYIDDPNEAELNPMEVCRSAYRDDLGTWESVDRETHMEYLLNPKWIQPTPASIKASGQVSAQQLADNFRNLVESIAPYASAFMAAEGEYRASAAQDSRSHRVLSNEDVAGIQYHLGIGFKSGVDRIRLTESAVLDKVEWERERAVHTLRQLEDQLGILDWDALERALTKLGYAGAGSREELIVSFPIFINSVLRTVGGRDE